MNKSSSLVPLDVIEENVDEISYRRTPNNSKKRKKEAKANDKSDVKGFLR